MNDSLGRIKVLCEQYFIEGNKDVFLAYTLMTLEYGLIEQPMPVKDLEEFRRYLEQK